MGASNMNAEQSGNAVAIVGYSYRMPGGIRTDDDFWRLLAEREIVQEPVTERYGRGIRPIGGSPTAGRLASPWEGLIRDDGGEALRSQSLRNVPQRDAADGATEQDVAELRLGDLRAVRVGSAFTAQQPHRRLHRRTGSSRGQLAADARRERVHRHEHQRRHAGQPHLLPLQSDGLVDIVLHGLLGRNERPPLGDERTSMRRLRASRGGIRQLHGLAPPQ